MFLTCMLGTVVANAQGSGITVKGHVTDQTGEPVIGATILVKNTKGTGTATDFDGNFVITVPDATSILQISYVGMNPKTVKVNHRQNITVVLQEDQKILSEVVVVGYGQQKKASVVGAITQTTGKTLERAGGVTSVGAALTGNLPGVITAASSGMPGAEDPKIIIRTQSSWNNSDPLILVDGIEREMSSVDISSIESISVLKDASATAVYGVKGANGVILITTKRGKEGKANIEIKANITAKVASQLPKKYDAYDTFYLMNRSIERESALNPKGWSNYTPAAIIEKYRYPANTEEWDRYPNTDWEKALFKKSAISYNTSVNVSGGSRLVRYFAAVDFTHEGDLFKQYDNHRGYNTGFAYNRVNVRSKLDFNLTKTTKLMVNLFGSNGQSRTPWNYNNDDGTYWASAFKSAPDAMRPIYSNGLWGWYAPRNADVPNSVYQLATSGLGKRTTTKMTTDFALTQDLDMVTSGLSARVGVSFDYTFREVNRGLNDLYHNSQRYWVDPVTGDISLEKTDPNTGLDAVENPILWQHQSGNVDIGSAYRKLYYSAQLNYDHSFGKHNITALGLFSRQRDTWGSDFAHYREDWVFRLTYNYAMRYFFETNGAYNGSEKFGPDHRFEFFPSLSLGWMVSDESFMKTLRDKKVIDMLKLRASWGRVGDDNVGERWLYQDQLAYGGNMIMGSVSPSNTPYTFYKIAKLGNPDISWEKVEKRNLGIDYGFLGGFITGSVDIFNDSRTDILMRGSNRAIPSYFGLSAPWANLGRVNSKGYEIEVKFNHTFHNGIHAWLNTSMTHAINKVKFRDDPVLKPDYQKNAGHSLGQTQAYIDKGNLHTWDDVIGSTVWTTGNEAKLPGDYNIVDFNGDGVVDVNDRAPYGYSNMPQNTYNASMGMEWKGWSFFVQFYGVSNITREVHFNTFRSTAHVAYDEGQYWTPSNDATLPLPRWATTIDDCAQGTRYLFDGSYVRLKNLELAYTMKGAWLKKIGINTCRIYLNGNNLFMWTKMPDDREIGGSADGAYPTMRRFNLGFDITL
ncbi:SusC/RagA family TonB-linked outer membrane protein [Hallella bergensis]|uniref:SusC/RagA family TonB-linked outer membrane protein n=1 Tax=Hallella bergensis TaxID=242750 RepID=UPI003990C64B